jgi:hypothetical protein
MKGWKKDLTASERDGDSDMSSMNTTGSMHGSSYENSGHDTIGSHDECNTDQIKTQLSKKETVAVIRLRLIFLLIQMAVAGAVAFAIYHVTTKAENEAFVVQYDGVSEKIVQSFLGVVDSAASIMSVSKAATIYGLDHPNSSWPFHTISHYPERAATARLLSGTLYVSMLHIVAEKDRKEWEEYVVGPDRKWM